MAVDSLGFGDALATMPEQLASAHEAAGKVPASALPDANAFDRVVTLGMGGSGIVGNILQAVGTAMLPAPVTVLKHYRTPAFVNDRTLAFALSYSGDTEETVEPDTEMAAAYSEAYRRYRALYPAIRGVS